MPLHFHSKVWLPLACLLLAGCAQVPTQGSSSAGDEDVHTRNAQLIEENNQLKQTLAEREAHITKLHDRDDLLKREARKTLALLTINAMDGVKRNFKQMPLGFLPWLGDSVGYYFIVQDITGYCQALKQIEQLDAKIATEKTDSDGNTLCGKTVPGLAELKAWWASLSPSEAWDYIKSNYSGYVPTRDEFLRLFSDWSKRQPKP